MTEQEFIQQIEQEKGKKLADFRQHCTNLFNRSMPWQDLDGALRQPDPLAWSEFERRRDAARATYGPDAIAILANSGSTSIEKRWPKLHQAYLNSTGSEQAFDPEKMDWGKASKAAEKFLASQANQALKIFQRGGLSIQDAALHHLGLLRL